VAARAGFIQPCRVADISGLKASAERKHGVCHTVSLERKSLQQLRRIYHCGSHPHPSHPIGRWITEKNSTFHRHLKSLAHDLQLDAAYYTGASRYRWTHLFDETRLRVCPAVQHTWAVGFNLKYVQNTSYYSSSISSLKL
jgi:hypothetical protein